MVGDVAAEQTAALAGPAAPMVHEEEMKDG